MARTEKAPAASARRQGGARDAEIAAQAEELRKLVAEMRARAGIPARAGDADPAAAGEIARFVQGVLASRGRQLPGREADCDIHGAYTSREIHLLGQSRWSGCPVCAREAADQRLVADALRGKQVREAKRLAKLDAMLAESGVSQRFLKANLQTLVPESADEHAAQTLRGMAKIAQGFLQRLERSTMGAGNLLVYGGWNTGKTHLGCAIVRAVLEGGFSGYYTTQSRMIASMRRSWGARSDGADQIAFADVDVLVIDEVGVGYGTEAEKLQLFDLLDARYQNRLSTVLITNMTIVQTWEFLGQRLQKKLNEDGLEEIECLDSVDF